MKEFPIIDADGHVTESLASLKKHLKVRTIRTGRCSLLKHGTVPSAALSANTTRTQGTDDRYGHRRHRHPGDFPHASYRSARKRKPSWPSTSPAPTTTGSLNSVPQIPND